MCRSFYVLDLDLDVFCPSCIHGGVPAWLQVICHGIQSLLHGLKQTFALMDRSDSECSDASKDVKCQQHIELRCSFQRDHVISKCVLDASTIENPDQNVNIE
jgi:hypothetical protein